MEKKKDVLTLLIKYSQELCYILLSSWDSILGIKVSEVLMHSRGMKVTPSQVRWKQGLRHFHSLCNWHVLIKLVQQLFKLGSTADKLSDELFSTLPSSVLTAQCTFQSSYPGLHPRGQCLISEHGVQSSDKNSVFEEKDNDFF